MTVASDIGQPTQSLDWGYRDNDLYGEKFTGRAGGILRCTFCLRELHSSEECTQGNQTQNDYQVTQRDGKGVHCLIPVQGHHIERGDINNNDGVKPRD